MTRPSWQNVRHLIFFSLSKRLSFDHRQEVPGIYATLRRRRVVPRPEEEEEDFTPGRRCTRAAVRVLAAGILLAWNATLLALLRRGSSI